MYSTNPSHYFHYKMEVASDSNALMYITLFLPASHDHLITDPHDHSQVFSTDLLVVYQWEVPYHMPDSRSQDSFENLEYNQLTWILLS